MCVEQEYGKHDHPAVATLLELLFGHFGQGLFADCGGGACGLGGRLLHIGVVVGRLVVAGGQDLLLFTRVGRAGNSADGVAVEGRRRLFGGGGHCGAGACARQRV